MACVFLCLQLRTADIWRARVACAFIMDRIFEYSDWCHLFLSLHLIWMRSRALLPGIMANFVESSRTRRIVSDDDATTFTAIPCGAKLPGNRYDSFIVAARFYFLYILGNKRWVAPLMYFVGIGMKLFVLVSFSRKLRMLRSKAPFIMELPNYHILRQRAYSHPRMGEYGHSLRRPNNPVPMRSSNVGSLKLWIQPRFI